MRKFKVNVNGVAYTVEVAEEGVVAAAPVAAAPVAAPAPAPVAAPAPAAVAAGDTPLTAPMPGKVSKIVAKAGDAVKKGDVVLMLEAMKMQNEIAAPVDGTVKSINVDVNENVKPGQIMAVIG
ncbi:biotin/lipoyl attachment domain-containing protein [Phascolarctobacterium sp. CAG:266]|nr:biotin/lipoyl attachment domain-containing protein [Phascolarctobacterium sp. CAG:266]